MNTVTDDSQLQPIRLLVVDDSVVVRGALIRALNEDADLEVVGTANNGAAGLERLASSKPDLVLLDIEMPGSDGLDFLDGYRAVAPDVPVLVFSSVTHRGAMVTLEALSRGAVDYVPKPTGIGEHAIDRHEVMRQLKARIRAVAHAIPRTRASGGALTVEPSGAPVAPRPPEGLVPRFGPEELRLVVIGASTGGPEALRTVLSALPRDFGLPVLVVQHMPPTFTQYLALSLTRHCPLEVREAEGGEALLPGRVFVAPGGAHLGVHRQDGALSTVVDSVTPALNHCRPSVDVLIDSAREATGGAILAIILTGMGQDGADAAVRLVEAGGRVWAQNEESSVIWGMPRAVVTRGVAEEVLPLVDIASRLSTFLSARSPR